MNYAIFLEIFCQKLPKVRFNYKHMVLLFQSIQIVLTFKVRHYFALTLFVVNK